MHLLIPFASALSEEALRVLPNLALPHLTRLLGRLSFVAGEDGDAYALSPPHERALASTWGWRGADGMLPFAAHAATIDGIEVGDKPWGLVTPSHWHVGREHITMVDPAALALNELESRELFEAVCGLFESAGYTLVWGAPDRWYASHPSFANLPCASLDRVIGRNVDFWLGTPDNPRAQTVPIRRLQSEVQLLLYPHPINEAREARGQLAVNSFWLSGCGVPQPADHSVCTVDNALRQPLLDGDIARWAKAWSALDAGPVARLLRESESGTARAALTLCGERSWQHFERRPRSLWQRLRERGKATPRPDVVLQTL